MGPTIEIFRELKPEQLANAYGHLHHADALRLLEEARNAYLESLGYTLASLLSERGLLVVVAELKVKYLRELRVGQLLVTFKNPRVVGKALLGEQEIFNQRGKLALAAEVDLRFVDGSSRRGVAVPLELGIDIGTGLR